MTDNSHMPDDHARTWDEDDVAEAEIVEAVELVGAPSAESLGLSLPDDPEEAAMILLHELADAREESGELLGNIQRLAAEFDNFRKRTERDQVENIQRAGQRVIETLLPALDSFDAALSIEATTDTEARMLEGMRGTYALVVDALTREGFTPIEAIGEPFDPALHEAVSVIPGDGDQVVQQELRKGYVMRGRVIRPSLVIVGHA
jgi:molecular chaperone GrpE